MADKDETKLLKQEKKKLKLELKLQEKKNVEIRDRMAMERTRFANERTFMAYLRTSMALLLAGLSLIKFFDEMALKAAGAIFIPAGIIVSIVGLHRFLKKQKQITIHKQDYAPTSHKHAQMAEKDNLPTSGID
ncbi:MAG: DUF202 domain-containing protein [Hymenobacteraceae bacterium]|nr:DUF202 domain-containing protein [Hymenobacteraceae bacterium]MDX5396564.1 DUF202 domain-containing protein [Hymenobacteraceae bacterium]MDX5444310.1 DUF202 domain-containing protein [Hymenobacteraceae bacterium]MDX5512627.1 DUF202 domain-containing protein [Hymenobacteraceae bacterium]